MALITAPYLKYPETIWEIMDFLNQYDSSIDL